ncbi:MAG: putative bifunctional diguanylate cyclase/phosphodiesterase [Mycobacteriales bacterium]
MSEHVPVVDPRPGRAFDALVTLGGVAVAVIGFTLWVSSPMTAHPQTVIAAVLVVIMTQFPLVLPQRAGDAAIGFEASALVFMVLMTSTGEALSLWFLAQLITQLLDHRSPRVRLFNFGITNLSAGALAGVIVLGMSVHRDTVGELSVTLAACAAYFLVDLIVTGMSLAIEAGDQPLSGLRWTGVPLPLLCFVGIDTLGYLAAVLQRHLASWTLVLLLVPVGTILVAVRSINAVRTSHERLSQLFNAASTAPDWGDAADTEARLLDEVSTVLRRTTARILDRPAVGAEISASLEVRGRPVRHVVAWRARSTEKFDSDDIRALETLVGIAAAAINRRRLADEMTHLARHDALTGLANRTVFTDRLDHALELRRDAGPAKQVAILYCDLDGFKSVNDRRGHETGDLLLAIVAGRIQSCLRPGDTAARLGGDEFAVLLEQVTTGGAEQVAERIREQIAAPLKIDGREMRVTASIGIAYVSDELRAVDVMRHADTAMYGAKADGKNGYRLFHPVMQADSMSRLRLEDELRLAVQDKVFTVAYQPIVDLATGELSSFEALARWEHPELGVIAPDRFIPIAERLGLIGEIGLHMLEEAYAGAHLLQSRMGRPLGLAVNVSPLQITDPKLVRWVQNCVARHPQIGLTLELTEMSRLGDDDATVRALDELVGAGAVLAADDFGTGYSSISYLHRLPVTTVKIDRSFTKDLTVGRSLPVVKGVIAMTQAMNLTVVAEGIEDGATAAELRDMGVRWGQGYYFSRPMTLAEALASVAADGATSMRGYAAAAGA